MKMLVLFGGTFPYGFANSSRVLNYCRLFSSLGYDVHVIAIRSKESNYDINSEYRLETFSFQTVTRKKPSSLQSYTGCKEFIRSIKEYLNYHKVDAIFLDSFEPYFRRTIGFLKRTGAPIYIDQCEWMDVSSYRLRYIDWRYIRRNWLINNGYKKVDGVVSISRLLNQHFCDLGVRTVRVPTILDVENASYSETVANKKIRIVYSGNPSHSKEYLKPMIQLLADNETFREHFCFEICGPSETKVIANIGGDRSLLDKAGDSVVIRGMVPQEKMAEILQNAWFQLFIRPNRRSSNAGFPTKLGESMMNGTPVITNDTGDISLYLRDGVNGFLLENNSIDALRNTLERVLTLSGDEYKQMRVSARRTAENSFDYRRYNSQMSDLFRQEE